MKSGFRGRGGPEGGRVNPLLLRVSAFLIHSWGGGGNKAVSKHKTTQNAIEYRLIHATQLGRHTKSLDKTRRRPGGKELKWQHGPDVLGQRDVRWRLVLCWAGLTNCTRGTLPGPERTRERGARADTHDPHTKHRVNAQAKCARHTDSRHRLVHCAVQYKQWVYTWSICQSNLQVLQRKLQRRPGPDTNTQQHTDRTHSATGARGSLQPGVNQVIPLC